jgi:DNA-binding MarR family transcriptional regulator
MDTSPTADRADNVSFRDEQILLALLTAVERDCRATQRGLAEELDIALGMANAYLKRCLKKGYVKVKQIPANRYLYYLTPHGFAEKARLTGEYLTQSFDFFRQARGQCADILAECARQGVTRVALAGGSELAEIMVLCAGSQTEVTIVGMIEPAARETRLAGLAVAAHPDQLPAHDAVVITALVGAQSVWQAHAGRLGSARVLAPPMLGITATLPVLAE